MYRNEQLDLMIFQQGRLTQAQAAEFERLKERLMRAARQARAEAVRELLGALARPFAAAARGLAAFVHRQERHYAARRARRAAVNELSALDDRTLKDLGLHRSEIESVIFGDEARRQGKVAAILLHKPPRRRDTAPATACLLDRTAA
jgi:uncharacterized protein YjiS (DUF1127 family)